MKDTQVYVLFLAVLLLGAVGFLGYKVLIDDRGASAEIAETRELVYEDNALVCDVFMEVRTGEAESWDSFRAEAEILHRIIYKTEPEIQRTLDAFSRASDLNDKRVAMRRMWNVCWRLGYVD